MISKTAERMWGVALLMLSPGYLIDKFLDWVAEFRPVYVDRARGGRDSANVQMKEAGN